MKYLRSTSLRRGTSTASIVLLSFVTSFFVLACTQFLQWLVYDDWLHRTGPLHIVGGTVAALLTFMFIFRWQSAIRERQAEMLRRFETIAEMNNRIRNGLQIIACTTYAQDSSEHVRLAVAVGIIDNALQGIVADVRPGATEMK